MLGFVLANAQGMDRLSQNSFPALLPFFPAIHPCLPAPELLADTDIFTLHSFCSFQNTIQLPSHPGFFHLAICI